MTAKGTDRLKIALAQMNQRVGDLEGNSKAMLEMRHRAAADRADLLVCPELQLVGYPPEDLVLKPEFVRRVHECTDELVAATVEPGPALLIGTLYAEGPAVYNALILADGGKVLGRTLKRELPNYGTFDEKRVFTPGPLPEPVEFKGVKLGLAICEDIWQEIVCAHLAEAGAELLLVPNGSPYELDKDDKRYQLVRSRALQTGLPIAYLNRVGGQDELAFDGSSFIVHPDGERGNPFVDMQAMSASARLDDPGLGLRDNGREVLSYAKLHSSFDDPDGRQPGREIELHLTGHMERFTWSFNGQKFSDAEPLRFNYGERLRIVLVNDSMMTHPIHLHGMWSDLEDEDGNFQVRKHTIDLPPGTRRSYRVRADALGQWAYHCHLLYHMESGMMRTVRVEE